MTLSRRNKNQKGATLLLAVLVLAAMSAIVFSVSAIAINEIRSNSDVARTEPVLKADEGIAEDSLFKIIRGFSTVGDCNSPSSSVLNGVTVTYCAGAYLNNPYSFELAADDRKDMYLVNPTSQAAAPGYNSVSVTILGGSTGTVYLCTIDVTDCPSSPQSTRVLNPSTAPTWSSALDPSMKYQVIVINGAGVIGSYSVTTSPNGLPAGVTTLQTSGSRQNVTRKLQILVPQ